MVIFCGRRDAGDIDRHRGERVATRFLHAFHLPIVPEASRWVTDDRGDFEIAPHTRSIVAAYLRAWSPIVAALALVFAPLAVAIALLVPLAGGYAWAWRARTLRGGHAIRRSDMNLVAFATRCDPSLMRLDHRRRCRDRLDARWEQLEPDRPPEDVAELGARSREEAIVAYGLLRLAAVEVGTMKAALLADRILAGAADLPDAPPYRSDAGVSRARRS